MLHLLHISWRARISNEEVCQHNNLTTTHTHHPHHLSKVLFFGHIARSDQSMDHSQALRACVATLLRDWNCRLGRPLYARIRLSTIQRWSGIRLSSSTESSILEHAHGNGKVQHWTSNIIIIMEKTEAGLKGLCIRGIKTI